VEKEMETPITIGFWGGFKGWAERIRMLAEYLHIPYVFKTYSWKSDEWDKEKGSLKTELATLPYLLDGDYVITETPAIMHYLILKAGRQDLLGKNTRQQCEVIQVQSAITDLLTETTNSMLRDDQNMPETWAKNIIPRFEKLSKHLGTRKFVCGDDFTLADIILHSICQMHLGYKATMLDHLPNLKEHFARVSAIPEFAAFLASDRSQKSFTPPEYETMAKTRLNP
jgi:glutathione S-transferase